jgi:hypothetical protein
MRCRSGERPAYEQCHGAGCGERAKTMHPITQLVLTDDLAPQTLLGHQAAMARSAVLFAMNSPG